MNTLKKLIALFLVVSTIGFLPGCTEHLYNEDTYSENISYVLITEDKKTLVVIGKEHHYILNLPASLSTILLSQLHDSVSAHIGPFHVEPDGRIYGNVSMSLDEDASDEVRNAALAADFKENKYGYMRYRIDLEGTCYDAGSFRMPETMEKLNETHDVYIFIEHSAGRKVMNYMLTPITVAADGALAITAFGVIMSLYMVTIPFHRGNIGV